MTQLVGTHSDPDAASATSTLSGRRAVIAAIVGNTLEWYDFAVYGFFALTLAKLFFPTGDPTVSLLLTVATFGVGFIMRPVGALVLGTLADRRGRKLALSLTILLMALGTAMIGLAPTYATAGAWAPAIIVLARLIQGFSAGGEIGGATAFLVEHAPPARRGLYASWQQASQAGALLLGSLTGALLTGLLPAADIEAWGWRVPFLLGLLIAPVGLFIRFRVSETDSFKAILRERAARPEASFSPLRDTLGKHRSAVFVGFGITIAWTVCTYFFLVTMPTYAVRQLGVPQSASFLANSVGLVLIVILAPVFGAWSDKVGRRPIMLAAACGILLSCWPLLFWLTHQPSVVNLVLAQIVFAVLIAGFSGPAPAAMAELYPPAMRSTGLSIAYNLAVTIFGGFAPFITTWLIVQTGSSLAPAWYVMLAAAISLTTLTASSGLIRGAGER
ncbi:MAG: MFS transporter [Bosea sp.]|uniref:MFS transporter n=1 Tax=unclassified Bosea (in: a-proteobacteria) TaxID=2653178 RepID=UPI000969DD80|nr:MULTISPECIES: MFS transporter [unclassified Bosea (in: a-proteobacteria)]MBN9458211.1 MFS transporter [Bosea sp. (in: a-proteobacteria)]OJV07047.1 MAG: MFS transporter [Bosea sp. 67-29]